MAALLTDRERKMHHVRQKSYHGELLVITDRNHMKVLGDVYPYVMTDLSCVAR